MDLPYILVFCTLGFCPKILHPVIKHKIIFFHKSGKQHCFQGFCLKLLHLVIKLYSYIDILSQIRCTYSFVFKKVGRRGQTYSQNKKNQIRKSLKSYFKGVGWEGTSILILISLKNFICSPKSLGPTLSKLTCM